MTQNESIRKYKQIWLEYKIFLTNDDGEPILGDDRWALLSAIERTGSIMGAATELGISYRKVWGDLRKTEEALGFAFVEKQRGGDKGGSTCLTPDGKDFIEAYELFHREFQEAVHDVIRKFKRKLKYGEK
jgi:molybdate transport system regulatory protein